MKISFNKPFLRKAAVSSVIKVIESGRICGNGPVGRELERFMQERFKVKFAFLATSCTHALEMAMMSLDIRDGDEVILPSFSFVSAANAVVRQKARPVFVDIEKDSLNIDAEKLKGSITKRTRAIICVHYAGVSCAMEEIMEIDRKNDLYIIEDAAQAVGSKYKDRFLGTIGDIGCFSFHETKNFTCGEGGAFLTNNEKIARRVEVIREKGTDRAAFLRQEVERYTWRDAGSSYVLSEILAAMLSEQLKDMEYIIAKRKRIGLNYMAGLTELEKRGKIILPKFPIDNFNWHIFYFMVHSCGERNRILRKLKNKGIEATFHFMPLHLSPYARKAYGYKEGDFPVTEKVSNTLIRLPIYPDLSNKEQEYIIKSLFRILN